MCVSAVHAVRVFKVRLAVYANRLHLIRFLKEPEKSATGGRSLSQPESRVLRFFSKINRGFITFSFYFSQCKETVLWVSFLLFRHFFFVLLDEFLLVFVTETCYSCFSSGE